jgi:hypothetical protein
MSDTDALFWLRLIAVIGLVQVTILIAAVVGAAVFIRRTQARLDDWQRQHIAPVTARANEALGDVQDAAARFRAIDEDVRHALSGAAQRWHHAGARVRSPMAGAMRGVRAALATLAFGRQARRAAPAPVDREDLERFTNEGGAHHARQ